MPYDLHLNNAGPSFKLWACSFDFFLIACGLFTKLKAEAHAITSPAQKFVLLWQEDESRSLWHHIFIWMTEVPPPLMARGVLMRSFSYGPSYKWWVSLEFALLWQEDPFTYKRDAIRSPFLLWQEDFLWVRSLMALPISDESVWSSSSDGKRTLRL